METKQAQISSNSVPTKDEALRRLGVRSKRARNKVSSHVEHVHVDAGQRVMTKDVAARAAFACVSGTATLTDDTGQMFRLEAPFVVGSWATDDRRISQVTVDSVSSATFILIDWRVRDVVDSRVSMLNRWSTATQQAVTTQTAPDDVKPTPEVKTPFMLGYPVPGSYVFA